MRIVAQRVKQAKVEIDGQIKGQINDGWLVLLGITHNDEESHLSTLLEKLINLRAFADSNGKMNLNLLQTGGSLLVVSQFTLYADFSSGRRPSFTAAASPDAAKLLYEKFIALAAAKGINTQSGQFGANMEITLLNSGPVTFVLDSDEFNER
jgi:D-tyrosyl-tRNA(Tyr) deacylase